MEKQLTEHINKFIKYLTNERKYPNNTISSYTNDLNTYYSYIILKKINYLTINKEQIREYLKYLDQLKYSKSTISRNLSALRNFYTFLLNIKAVKTNPYKNIRNPKKDKKLPNFLQIEELQQIFDSIETDTALGIRNRLIIELLYATGIRVSELTELKLKQIDLSNKEIRIFGKGSKERIVFFGDYAKKYLNKYLNESRNELLQGNKSEYLLINYQDRKSVV